MKTHFNDLWFENFKLMHPPGNLPGEDLRYDEVFTELKNQNGALSPDCHWMLEKSSSLLMRSVDWRVCMYALHAAAISGEPRSIATAFSVYAYIVTDKFYESFPAQNGSKIATLDWCKTSQVLPHLITHQDKFSEDQLLAMQNALATIYQGLEINAQEFYKWHDLDEFLIEQLKKREVIHQEKSNKFANSIGDCEEIKKSQDAKPFFHQLVHTLMKEGQYEKAIALSRAHRWCPLVVPHQNDLKTPLEIRQESIDIIKRKVEKEEWENVLCKSEELFLHPQGHYYFQINYWSHLALIKMNQIQAAEMIIMHLKILNKNYGQVFPFMYNGGQSFAEGETLSWIKQVCEEKFLPNTAKIKRMIRRKSS